MVGVMAVLMTLALTATVIAVYLAAAHRARTAADLAALSGAVAVQQGGDGCARAKEIAAANDAEVTACDQVGDQIDFVVTVTVRVDLRSPVAALPRSVAAVAYAGPASLSSGSAPTESTTSGLR